MQKAVIFDLGGVLVTYQHEQMLAELSAVTALGAAEMMDLLPPIAAPFGRGEMDGRSFHQFFVTQAGATPDADAFAAAFNACLQRIERGIAFALRLQQQGAPIGVISNTNEMHVAHMRTLLPELATFDAVILSSDVGLLKPDPAIYRLALTRLGMPADRALFLDDHAENVTGAQAVGMAAHLHRDWDETATAVSAWLHWEGN